MEINVGEAANLGRVPSNRVELVHTASQRSTAASEGAASSADDESEGTVVRRQQTPKAGEAAVAEEEKKEENTPDRDSIESGQAVRLPIQGGSATDDVGRAVSVDHAQDDHPHTPPTTDEAEADRPLQETTASAQPITSEEVPSSSAEVQAEPHPAVDPAIARFTPEPGRQTASPLPRAPGAFPNESTAQLETERRRPFSGLNAIAAAAAGFLGVTTAANTGKRLQKEQPKAPAATAAKESATTAKATSTGKEPASKSTAKAPPKAMAHWSGARPMSEASAASPEDDSPYIEFALDQLTRDEELMGRSRDRSGSPDIVPVDTEAEGKLARTHSGTPATFVPSRGGTYHYTPMTGRRDSKRLSKDSKRSSGSAGIRRFSSGKSRRSRDSSHMTPTGVALAAPMAASYQTMDVSPVESEDEAQRPAPLQPAREPNPEDPRRFTQSVSPMSERPDDTFAEARPAVPPKDEPLTEQPIAEHPAAESAATDRAIAAEQPPVEHTVTANTDDEPPIELPPVDPPITSRLPPHDLYRYPPLTFIPSSLRLPALGVLIVIVLVLIALLTLSVVWSFQREGLWPYDGVGTGRYFLAQYLPTLLAATVVIWVQVVQAALQRILPFVLLSRKTSASTGDVFTSVPLYISNYLWPNRSMFQTNEPVLAYVALSFWLNLFTVPLASAVYQTRLFPGPIGWCWVAVGPIGVVMLGLYLNLVLALLALHLRLRMYPTGLKWDPVSLADVLVLIRKTTHTADTAPLPNPHRASLGYWESHSHPGDFYHGLGSSPSAAQLEIQRGKTVRSHRSQRSRRAVPAGQPAQASTFESWKSTGSAGRLRPWFLRESMLALFAVVALVLAIAFVVVSYVRAPLSSSGFDPRLPIVLDAPNTFRSFSPANFLYSFVPALIGMLVPLLWTPLDNAARYFAPYLALVHSEVRGVTTEGSLLLSYTADGPFVATIRAASHGDYFVAVSSLLALLGWALPVLGGGLFTAQFVRGSDLVMRADAAGLGALTAFVLLCMLGWVAAWPLTNKKLRGGWISQARPGRGKAKEITPAQLEKGELPPERGCLQDWLAGTDLRYLAGIHDAMGDAVLTWPMWREPRTREDLVGRLIGRGRGRWSWMGRAGAAGGGIRRFDV